MLTDSEVGELSERVASNCGQKNGNKEVNKFLLEKQKKMGLAPASGKRLNDTTLSNYLALLAQRFNLCLTNNSIPKTNACFTEETSLIGRMA